MADLLSDPHVLSKIWKKSDIYIETEEERLRRIANETLHNFKNRKIISLIQRVQIEILKAQDQQDEVLMAELLQNMNTYMQMKNYLSGNRVTT